MQSPLQVPGVQPEPKDGIFDLRSVISFLVGRSTTIISLAACLAIVCIAGLLLLPFPFLASAIVFVDPRDEKVTLQEEVLPAIGTDAAVLESMVQIVKSDGFLIEMIQKLKLVDSGTWTGSEAQVKELAKLRKKIGIERMGATYLVKVSYSDDIRAEAARIANEIAAAFASSQNGLRSKATIDASRSLSERLVELRSRLAASEEAVARFKAENNIVYIDERNTVQMRQLSDLSQQLALIKNGAEDADARYSESVTNGTFTRSMTQGNDEGDQLSFLRRQRAQLAQVRDQQVRVYGPRHPRLVETQQMIEGVDRQIAEQRSRIGGQLKSERDVNFAKEQQLTKQIEALSRGISETEEQRVKLAALDREAAANRDLYQQLLSRTKATNELAQQPADNVRVVSPAVPPLASTRPPLILLIPVVGFFSLVFAILLIAVFALFRPRFRKAAGEPAAASGASVRSEPEQPPSRPKVRPASGPRKSSLLSLIPDR
jgi:uncharacterized protein involved in exopolysaccharide biosynthesis